MSVARGARLGENNENKYVRLSRVGRYTHLFYIEIDFPKNGNVCFFLIFFFLRRTTTTTTGCRIERDALNWHVHARHGRVARRDCRWHDNQFFGRAQSRLFSASIGLAREPRSRITRQESSEWQSLIKGPCRSVWCLMHALPFHNGQQPPPAARIRIRDRTWIFDRTPSNRRAHRKL